MTAFAYDALPEIPDAVREAQRGAWLGIAGPGSWWSGAQRVEIARQAREARRRRADPPWLRQDLPDAGDLLPEDAVRAARTIAADAHQIDRAWAHARVAALGDAAYVELAGIAASVCAIDTYADALGVALEPLPEPVAGDPDGFRNDAVKDVGAHVPLQDPWPGPNVSRAFSLVPDSAQTFFGLVAAMYAGPETFFALEWDGPLSRPQIELLAARVSAVNECFY